MKKLTKQEMRSIIGGGSDKTVWSCFSASAGTPVETCADFDPTFYCRGCGYSDCVDTAVTCNDFTSCVC